MKHEKNHISLEVSTPAVTSSTPAVEPTSSTSASSTASPEPTVLSGGSRLQLKDLIDAHGSANWKNLTYKDALNAWIAKDSEPGLVRRKRHLANTVVDFLSVAISDPMSAEFIEDSDAVAERFADFGLDSGWTAATVKDAKSKLKSFQRIAIRLILDGEAPSTFKDFLRWAMAKKGVTTLQFKNKYGAGAYGWAMGRATPRKNKSAALVTLIEKDLDLLPGQLMNLAHPDLKGFEKVSLVEPSKSKLEGYLWNAYITAVKGHSYNLDPKVNLEIDAFIEEFIAHKKRHRITQSDGKTYTPAAKERLNSPASQEIREVQLRNFFGFLMLPVHPSKAWLDLNWQDRMIFGLIGKQAADLSPLDLINSSYLFAYADYQQNRSYDEKFFAAWQADADIPVDLAEKTLNQTFNNFMMAVNGTINKPHSLFVADRYALAQKYGVTEPDLVAWQKRMHQGVLDVNRNAQRVVQKDKRNSSRKLDVLLRDKNPMSRVQEVLQKMRQDAPAATSPVFEACHWRDVAIISLLSFIPLRGKNLAWLRIGEHIRISATEVWLHISKEEFKNNIHGHAQDIDVLLPAAVAADIKKWVNVYRPRIEGHDKTTALFTRVGRGGGVRGAWATDRRTRNLAAQEKTNDLYAFSNSTLTATISKYFIRYLGISVSKHDFRSIAVTSVFKNSGNIGLAKALLNNSEAVTLASYNKIQNSDFNAAIGEFFEANSPKNEGME